MKAVRYDRYGGTDVLHIKDIAKPRPSPNQVLVKTHYAGLLPYDSKFMRAKPFIVRLVNGFFAPKRKILGLDFSGTVEAIGDKVLHFQVGDEVFGLAREAFAEYILAKEDQIVMKPKNLSFQHASITAGSAFTALQCLRNYGHVQEGQEVLINGASGGVGTFAVQLAKHFGTNVTGVCSGRNIKLVHSIGADHVLNYEETQITESGKRYDLILDAVGNHSISTFKQMLKPNGRFVAIAGSIHRMMWLAIPGRVQMRSVLCRPDPEDLKYLAHLLEEKFITPILDQSFPFERVADAINYLETGRVRGKLALKVSHD